MSTQPTQPGPITAAEFTAIALALGADPNDFKLDTAYAYLQYQPAPDRPFLAINQVRNALQSGNVPVTR